MIRRLPIILVALVAAGSAQARLRSTTRARFLSRRVRWSPSNQTHNEKLAALSVLFGKFLDSDAMGREALGQHWSSFTPTQQKEFLALFRELLQRTYVQKLLLFENPDFVYAGQQFTGNGAIVDTKIVTPRDQFDVSIG